VAAAAEAAERRRRREAEAEARGEVNAQGTDGDDSAATAATPPPPPPPPEAALAELSEVVSELSKSVFAAADAGADSTATDEGAVLYDWISLPPGVLQSMREAVIRRCKGLNAKQLRQLAAHLAAPEHAVATGAAGGVAAAAALGGGGSWLPLDPDVTARVVRALSAEGFSPDQVRRFFMQPVAAAVAEGGLTEADLFDHVPPPLLFLVRALLKVRP
jgi:hypothetical protein